MLTYTIGDAIIVVVLGVTLVYAVARLGPHAWKRSIVTYLVASPFVVLLLWGDLIWTEGGPAQMKREAEGGMMNMEFHTLTVVLLVVGFAGLAGVLCAVQLVSRKRTHPDTSPAVPV